MRIHSFAVAMAVCVGAVVPVVPISQAEAAIRYFRAVPSRPVFVPRFRAPVMRAPRVFRAPTVRIPQQRMPALTSKPSVPQVQKIIPTQPTVTYKPPSTTFPSAKPPEALKPLAPTTTFVAPKPSVTPSTGTAGINVGTPVTVGKPVGSTAGTQVVAPTSGTIAKPGTASASGQWTALAPATTGKPTTPTSTSSAATSGTPGKPIGYITQPDGRKDPYYATPPCLTTRQTGPTSYECTGGGGGFAQGQFASLPTTTNSTGTTPRVGTGSSAADALSAALGGSGSTSGSQSGAKPTSTFAPLASSTGAGVASTIAPSTSGSQGYVQIPTPAGPAYFQQTPSGLLAVGSPEVVAKLKSGAIPSTVQAYSPSLVFASPKSAGSSLGAGATTTGSIGQSSALPASSGQNSSATVAKPATGQNSMGTTSQTDAQKPSGPANSIGFGNAGSATSATGAKPSEKPMAPGQFVALSPTTQASSSGTPKPASTGASTAATSLLNANGSSNKPVQTTQWSALSLSSPARETLWPKMAVPGSTGPLAVNKDKVAYDWGAVQLARASYNDNMKVGAQVFKNDPNWVVADKRVDPKTGFLAYTFVNEKERRVVVGIQGSRDLKLIATPGPRGDDAMRDWAGDAKAIAGGNVPGQFHTAEKYVADVKAKYGSQYAIDCSGHSMGGGACVYAASKTPGVHGIAVDPISSGSLATNNSYAIDNYYVEREAAGTANKFFARGGTGWEYKISDPPGPKPSGVAGTTPSTYQGGFGARHSVDMAIESLGKEVGLTPYELAQ